MRNHERRQEGADGAGERYAAFADPRPYGLPEELFERAYVQCPALGGTGIQRRDFCPERCAGFLGDPCPKRQAARSAVEGVDDNVGAARIPNTKGRWGRSARWLTAPRRLAASTLKTNRS